MTEEILRKTLVDSLTTANAHVSVKDAINNIDTELLNKEFAPGSHTIWQEFEHMLLAQEDILKYIVDPDWVSPKWPEGYWPSDKAKKEDWEKSVEKFFNDMDELVKIINDKKIDLTSIIPHTQNHSYLREIILVIDHNSYHMGQLVQIRKALGNW